MRRRKRHLRRDKSAEDGEESISLNHGPEVSPLLIINDKEECVTVAAGYTHEKLTSSRKVEGKSGGGQGNWRGGRIHHKASQ